MSGATAGQTPIVNIAEVPLRDSGHGEAFVAKLGRIGPIIGSTGIGCTLHVVPAGKRAWPFHRHHVIHELFLIVAGAGEYRLGAATHPIRAGDVIAAPAGGEAHQIVNTGDGELRYLAFSSKPEVDIMEYPDTGKFAATAGVKNADFRTATFRYLGRPAPADYWEGEG
jgi:uncharacterized cupin superfamily protein